MDDIVEIVQSVDVDVDVRCPGHVREGRPPDLHTRKKREAPA